MKYHLSLLILSLLCLVHVTELRAGQYYWIKGKGNWSDLTHWQILTKSGKAAAGQVPGSIDTVYFDANSFTADNQKVTIDIKGVCHTMDWRNSCTTYKGVSMDGSKNLDIFGSLYFDPAMGKVKFNGQLHFLSNNTGNVIDGQSVYVEGANNGGTMLFDGSGSWKFISSWLMNQGYGSSQRAGIVHNTGTLDFNGQTVSAGWLKSASGSTRSLKMDYAELDIISAHIPKVIEIDQKKLTFSGDGLRIYISRNELGNLEVSAPGLSWGTLAVDPNVYSLNITKSITLDTLENRTDMFIGADITINDRLYMLSGSVLRIQTAKTVTLGSNAILTAIGACNKIIEFRSDGFDSAFGSGTLKKTGSWGASSVKYASFRNVIVSASTSLSVSNGYDLGANSGVSFSSPITGSDFYWIGGTGHWVDAKHWSNTSGGTSCGCVPGPTDDVYFDANSFSNSGDTVVFDILNTYCKNVDFSGLTKNMLIASSITGLNEPFPRGWHVYGSMKFSNKSSFDTSYAQTIYLDGNGNHTLTSAGIVFSSGIQQEGSGTYTLMDSLCMERNEVLSYNLIAGKLVLNGNTLNVPVFESGTITCPRTLDMSNSLIRLNVDFITGNSLAQWNMQQKNLTLITTGSTIRSDNSGSKKNVNFLGGNQTYHVILFLNPYPTVQINNNNTIDSLSIYSNAYVVGTNTVNQYFSLYQGKIYTFKGGITQYFAAGCNVQMQPTGVCADFITLMTDNGNQSYFSCPSGTINSSNLICNNMVAKGGATWNVTNFVDLGNNAGWTYTAASRRTLYWVGDNGLWSQESNWATSSGGTGGECIPTIVDDVIFDANSFKTSGAVVTLDMNDHNCHGMYWRNITNDPILRNQGNRLNCSGTLTFSQDMTVDFQTQFAILNLYGSDTDSVTLAGAQLVNINFHGRGDYYLMDDVVLQQGVAMGNMNFNHGGLYTQGHYLSMTNFNSPTTSDRRSNFSNSIVELSAPTNITPISWNYGTGATSWDFTQTTMRVLCSGPVGFESEFTTAPVTYHKLDIPYNGSNGIVQVSGSVINFDVVNLAQNTQVLSDINAADSFLLQPGGVYSFQPGSSITFDAPCFVSMIGDPSNPINIQSMTSNSNFSFIKSAGFVCADFIYIKDNYASGGAVYTAGVNSNDQGGNNGWDFITAYPKPGTGTMQGNYLVCPGDSFDVQVNITSSLPASIQILVINNNNDTTERIIDTLRSTPATFRFATKEPVRLVLRKVWVDKCFGNYLVTYVDTLNNVKVDVVSDSAIGTAYADHDTLCSGLKAYLYTDGTTNQYYWQQWDGTQWIDLPNIGPDSFVVNGSAKFRAHLFNNQCDTVASNEVTLVGMPILATGKVVSSSDTVCIGGSFFLKASAYQGNISWEVGDGFGHWTGIIHNTDTLTINSPTTLWVRNVVSFPSCGTFYGDSLQLVVLQPPSIGAFYSADTVICPPASVTLNTWNVTGNVTLQVDSNGSGWVDSPMPQPWVFYPTVNSKYRVKVDQPGCGTSWSDSLNVTVLPSLNVKIATPVNPVVLDDNPLVTFSDTGTGATAWIWHIDTQQVSTNQQFQYAFQTPGTYTITLSGTNAAGCQDWDTLIFEVISNYHFWLPNTFTPNHDGHNDSFFPKFTYVQSMDLILWDRWGEIVYKADLNTQPWDGTYRGRQCYQGMYFYTVDVTDKAGNVYHYRGPLNLMR